MGCAECACIVEQGQRTVVCSESSCCCQDVPRSSEARTTDPAA